MPEFCHDLRVYYEDTDEGGVVYYANYLKYAERARTECLLAIGLGNRDLYKDEGVRIVVKNVQAEYIKSAVLEDDLQVSVNLTDVKGASFTLEQDIRRSGDVLVQLQVKLVTINDAGKPVAIPNRLKEGLKRYG